MSDRPAWTANYIGIPFLDRGRDPAVGLDCWGAARHVLMSHYGFPELPMYLDNYEHTLQRSKIGKLITEQLMEHWRPAETIREGLLVNLRAMGRNCHLGVTVNETWFLHSEFGCDLTCEELNGKAWQGRVLGYYEYVG